MALLFVVFLAQKNMLEKLCENIVSLINLLIDGFIKLATTSSNTQVLQIVHKLLIEVLFFSINIQCIT